MKSVLIALALLLAPGLALAANCGAYPYTLINGQTADANQVMANFNLILGCANSNLAHNGANSDIISLSGLTTPLPQSEGGTGVTNINSLVFNPQVVVSGASMSDRRLNLQTLGVTRWWFDAGQTPESGGNTGSDLFICRFSDAGSQLDCPETITRSTGHVSFIDGVDFGSISPTAVTPMTGDSSTKVATTAFVQTTAAGAVAPVGSVTMYAATTPPTGWLLCNGAAISRTTYSTLFGIIGTAYGVGDGSTTFNLPDMRGEFPRGFDAGRGVDTGRTFGTTQADAFQGHYHAPYGSNILSTDAGSANVTIGGGNYSASPSTRGPITDGTNGTPRTAAETRPVNVTMSFIIKD